MATSYPRPSHDHDGDPRPYVVVSEIGKGSFATVYKGYHQDNHSPVAIKTVQRDKLSSKLLDNLKSEIRILNRLSHVHITKLVEIVHSERYIYIIMEYCSGGNLTNYIKARGRVEGLEYIPSPGAAPQYYPHPRTGGLDIIVVRSFLRQLARGLKALQKENVMHRDIKPQNLLLSPATPEHLHRGHPLGVPILKIADFGFARSLPAAMLAETLCGSPLYMAPEILRYQKYDVRADLWSVGAVLYEMAVGRPPFRAQNHMELLKKIETSKGVRFPDEEPPGKGGNDVKPVPDDIKQLIRALLMRIPLERMTYEQFFKSEALAKSKFPKPPKPPAEILPANPPPPEHHSIIPPEVLDPTAMIPPSKFNFRRTSALANQVQGLEKVPERSRSDANDTRVQKALSKEASIVPGESEEDGLLRREYVMVGDAKALEFNRTVEELVEGTKRSPHNRQSSSSQNPPLSEINTNTTFPPPPNVIAPAISSSPSSIASRAASNALNKALSLAHKKLWRTSSRPAPDAASSPQHLRIITVDAEGERDPMEEELLTELEELAQKTDVLTNWADELFEGAKPILESKDQQFDGNIVAEARTRAIFCLHIYMLVMSFSQKGVDKLRHFQENHKMVHPDHEFEVSEGFDDALKWFIERFKQSFQLTKRVGGWLSQEIIPKELDIRQYLYERALNLSKVAARRELFDNSYDAQAYVRLYEESLWCLYTLVDDFKHDSSDDEDAIATWVKRTKLRLVRCVARMNMEPKERQYDVRADVNLADVTRIPAPWEVTPNTEKH